MNVERPWTAYRTRFVVQARQLTASLVFIDVLGREHSGKPGDYLVESSDGVRRITPRHLFEDIYVPLSASVAGPKSPAATPGGRPAVRPHRSSEAISPPAWAHNRPAPAKGIIARTS